MKKKIFTVLKMTMVERCSVGVSLLFWQLVCIGVFGYSILFLFSPSNANKLFATPVAENVIRLMGAQLLLANAGLNAMMACMMKSSSKKTVFNFSILLYILSGISGLVIVSFDTKIYIHSQTVAFQILYSLFIAALVLGSLGTCRVTAGVQVKGLESVEVSNKMPSRLSRDDIRNARY